jgi:branched chain amino acid efflux pump
MTPEPDWLPHRSEILRAAIGIGLYAAAFGVSFGAVSVTSGMTIVQTMVLSLVMFSGASQFAFVGVAGGGGSPLGALAVALLLGVRNAFYGVAVSEILRPSRWARLPTAHLVVDESTAMAVGQSTPGAKRYAFWATGVALFVLWPIGSLIGAVLGSVVDPTALGMDAAAPAIFLALLWPRLREKSARWVALGGAAVAALLIPAAPSGLPVIAAAAVALIAGLTPIGAGAEQPSDPSPS